MIRAEDVWINSNNLVMNMPYWERATDEVAEEGESVEAMKF